MDNSPLDLEQMFSDVEDYLIIVEDLLSEMSSKDVDYKTMQEIVGWLENILDGIESIWYNKED